MDLGLLRNWLGLPEGPWPPENRALLGLPEGKPLDPAMVELRALEQMERLRVHQLKHPEVVTEGMNRLAQAMIALSTPAVAPAPVVAPKVHVPAAAAVAPKVTQANDLPLSLSLDSPGKKKSGSVPPPKARAQKAAPLILDAEVVEAEAPIQPKRRAEDHAEPVPIPEPPPGLVYWAETRRQNYRKLVELRRLQRAIKHFRQTVAIPSETLNTPSLVLSFLEAVDETRDVLKQGWTLKSGQTLLTIVKYPLPLGLLRDMVPDQRLALAKDWAVATSEAQGLYDSIRKELQQTKPKHKLLPVIAKSARWFQANPEWILGLIAAVLFLVAWARTRAG